LVCDIPTVIELVVLSKSISETDEPTSPSMHVFSSAVSESGCKNRVTDALPA
jgi:hypothetical protein